MALPTPYYQDDAVTIYHADCRNILPELPKVDLVLTDPPYGIGIDYGDGCNDNEDLVSQVVGLMPLIRSKGRRVALTCGVKNIWLYPRPDWVMAWVSNAGTGCSPWGFCCWQPILIYGKDPYLASMSGSLPDIFTSNETTKEKRHPCAKPINLWQKVLHRCSQADSDTVLDPFLGSGTTAVAAKKLGRKCIGIEIEERYCEIAANRCRQMVMELGGLNA